LSEDRIRVGLIGLGFAADLKLPCYAALPDVEIVAVADTDEAARERVRSKLNLSTDACHSHYHSLLEAGGIDFVDVSTPHFTHAEVLITAAEAGVPAVCDKPLAMTLAEADQVIGAAERRGVIGGVHRNFRWFPSWALLFDLVRAGAIGTPTLVSLSGFGIWTPGADDVGTGWRRSVAIAGGGVVMDYGPHLIYLAREALGQGQPRYVEADIGRVQFSHSDVEDRAGIRLGWDGGASALLGLSWGAGTTGENSVLGSDGSAKILYNGGHSAPHNVARGVAVLTGRQWEDFHPLLWTREPFDWYYRGSIAAFADRVRGHDSAAATYADGRADLEVALAAYASAATLRRVELPLVASDPVYQLGAVGVRELDLPPDSVVTRLGLFAETAR
jgi:predicted dehydrogenase